MKQKLLFKTAILIAMVALWFNSFAQISNAISAGKPIDGGGGGVIIGPGEGGGKPVEPISNAPTITNLSTSTAGFTSVNVNFNLNTFGYETTYVVEYGLTNNLLTTLGTIIGGTTTNKTPTQIQVNIPNLRVGKNYWTKVIATNIAGGSVTNSSNNVSLPNPFNVSNASISNITPNGAIINYTANSNNIECQLTIYVQEGTVFDYDGGFTVSVFTNPTFTSNGNNNYTYVINGLSPNKAYIYQVSLDLGRGDTRSIYLGNPFTTLTVLPLTLTSLTAKATPTGNQINWTSASSVNVKSITVERSGADNTFTTLATLPATATQFTDTNPLAGDNYYRLTSTDNDGTTTTYPKVAFVKGLVQEATFYPNPVINGVLNVVAGDDAIKSVNIINLNGVKVASAQAINNAKNLVISTNGLAKGAYVLEIKNIQNTTVKKIIVN